jgi:lactoylglutathione lyase
MGPGNFSVSLAVKDIEESKLFYEKLGFSVFGGDQSQNWLILKNGAHVIGLFQGMFDKNILTFNPGWNSDAQQLDKFTDVREIQRQLKECDVEIISEADDSSPAQLVLWLLTQMEIQYWLINTYRSLVLLVFMCKQCAYQIHEVDRFFVALQNYNSCKALGNMHRSAYE